MIPAHVQDPSKTISLRCSPSPALAANRRVRSRPSPLQPRQWSSARQQAPPATPSSWTCSRKSAMRSMPPWLGLFPGVGLSRGGQPGWRWLHIHTSWPTGRKTFNHRFPRRRRHWPRRHMLPWTRRQSHVMHVSTKLGALGLLRPPALLSGMEYALANRAHERGQIIAPSISLAVHGFALDQGYFDLCSRDGRNSRRCRPTQDST